MVSLKDVAEACGVSTRTINRALKEGEYVAPKTKQKILATIDRLGYKPDPAALALKTGKSSEVGMVLGLMDERHVEKVMGFEKVLSQAGYSTHVIFTTKKNNNVESIKKLISHKLAAIAIFPDTNIVGAPKIAAYFESMEQPYIFVDFDDRKVDSVKIDREQGIFDAVSFWVNSSLQKIAYVGPVKEDKTAVQKLSGYKKAMKHFQLESLHIETVRDRNLSKSDGEYQAGQEAAEKVLALDTPVEAIQVHSDIMALGLINTLQDQGVQVPHDIAIIGFDDREFAHYVRPQISTVAQPNKTVGMKGAEILLNKIHAAPKPKEGWSVTLPTQLIFRDSTKN